MNVLGSVLPVIIGFLFGTILGSMSRGDTKKTTLTILAAFITIDSMLFLTSSDPDIQLVLGSFLVMLLLGYGLGYWKYGKFRMYSFRADI